MFSRIAVRRFDQVMIKRIECPSATSCRLFSTPAGKKKVGMSDEESKEKAMDEAFARFLDTCEAAKKRKFNWGPEVAAEHYRIGREFNRQSMFRHKKEIKAITDQCYYQQDALAALPEKLREAAMVIDETPAPEMDFLYLTPPIKGFDASKWEEELRKEEADSESSF